MRWATSISDSPELSRAAADTVEDLRAQLGGLDPDLVVLFVSDAHRSGYGDLAATLQREFPGALVVGCSARSVIGAGRELENGPGLSLSAAQLPGVTLHPFSIDPATLPEGRIGAELFGVPQDARPHFIVLADSFTAQTERLVQSLDSSFPDAVKIGGLASGGAQPGENALFLGPDVHRFGLVGVALSGNLELDAIVAQGCRPIGQPMFVTRCRNELLLELDGRSPLALLEELYGGLTRRDQELFRSSLFVGVVMRSDQVEYRRGDFLIRNLVGMDEESGAIAVAADLHEAQVVQFHLRDGETSAEDLEACLRRYTDCERSSTPEGALLVSCLGRGEHLYGEPDHDSRAFSRHLGPLPLGGFFCNGEIGPVQNRTYLHGYTSSFGIFRPRAR